MGANKGGGQKFRQIMQTPAPDRIEGYVSSFIEIFAWIMTMPAYEALWNLFAPQINPYAWGYDMWYDGYARSVLGDGKKEGPGHRMAIASKVKFLHEQDIGPAASSEDGGGDASRGRTDKTDFKTKWQAVMRQEKYYQKHYGIPLSYFRKHMDLSDHTWKGPIKGELKLCSD
jgi:hypothetical protein